MRYEELKKEIKDIAEIAESVPEPFREKCFEMLLQNLLVGVTPPASPIVNQHGQTPPADPASGKTENQQPQHGADAGGTAPISTAIRLLMQKTGVTPVELNRVVLFEDKKVHFIHEPAGNGLAKGQIAWALLLALKNGYENSSLEVDPESVRSICQEKAYYDAANFQKNFKNSAGLFVGAMERQGNAQKLTADGQTELGKLIKELAAKAMTTA